MISEPDRLILTEHYGDRVFFDEPMARYTTFRCGGPAEALVYPRDTEELRGLLSWAAKKGIRRMVIGSGSNLLVRDGGIRGLVINLAKGFNTIRVAERNSDTLLIMAEAGVLLSRLLAFSVDHDLSGLSFAAGIPGTVGGAVRMNAGTKTGCMADLVETITVLPSAGGIADMRSDRLKFSYRKLAIDAGSVVVKAYLRFGLAGRDVIQQAAASVFARRKATQPLSFASAGSFFRNPADGPSAGELIEAAGLKGRRVNDAEVSEKHANFIINRGKATASDVLKLASMIRKSVFENSEMLLEPEVMIVGEEKRA
ncbi:MAG: UDP-N-acetylmuramate dehydrogenase [Deltaproteobacteria bacterium]|jgi:UDP-N-acetylmuramate dehydrogenase|nr:UDP-N-acetylmuramate dehydrogenase [Deltaproteobacteria bacterium]